MKGFTSKLCLLILHPSWLLVSISLPISCIYISLSSSLTSYLSLCIIFLSFLCLYLCLCISLSFISFSPITAYLWTFSSLFNLRVEEEEEGGAEELYKSSQEVNEMTIEEVLIKRIIIFTSIFSFNYCCKTRTKVVYKNISQGCHKSIQPKN